MDVHTKELHCFRDLLLELPLWNRSRDRSPLDLYCLYLNKISHFFCLFTLYFCASVQDVIVHPSKFYVTSFFYLFIGWLSFVAQLSIATVVLHFKESSFYRWCLSELCRKSFSKTRSITYKHVTSDIEWCLLPKQLRHQLMSCIFSPFTVRTDRRDCQHISPASRSVGNFKSSMSRKWCTFHSLDGPNAHFTVRTDRKLLL